MDGCENAVSKKQMDVKMQKMSRYNENGMMKMIM